MISQPLQTQVHLLQCFGLIKHSIEWFKNKTKFDKTVKTPRSNCMLSNKKIISLGLELFHPLGIIDYICESQKDD